MRQKQAEGTHFPVRSMTLGVSGFQDGAEEESEIEKASRD